MAKQREDADVKADEPTIGLDPSGTEPQTTSLRGEPAEKIGGAIGPYKLLDELGEGGMGTVYLAEQDRPVRRRVALKIIKPGLDTAQVIARFEAERQALALMDHSNIARVLDAGTTASGRPYFVMELVQGVPITSYCDQRRLPLRERLELFMPVCRAVQHAHQKGIIHRDLKPSNILVTLRDDQPVPKIIDFGIAKATTQRLTERTLYTQHGQLVGTPDYMSPEQAGLGGLDVDTRSDVYSLGAVLYELLCGDTPLGHQRLRELDFVAMLNVIYEDEPPTLSRRIAELGEKTADIARRRDTEPSKLAQSLKGELDWIVTKALEKERARRYESASALAADIERHLNNQPVEASPPSATYRLQKYIRRNRAPLAAAVTIALVLLGGIIVSGWQAYRATQAEQDMAVEREAALQAKGLAEARRRDAESAKQLAEAQRKLAEGRRTELAAALAKAEIAAKNERDARAEIEQRLREADAMRLAMNAKDSRQRYPQRALLLAAEAVETTRRKNEPIRSAAHQALREALDNIGGRPMAGHQSSVNFMQVTPNGRWLFTSDWQSVRRWDLAAENPVESSTLVLASAFNHRAMAISPDGRWLATLSENNNSRTLHLWDLHAENFDQPVRDIALSAQQQPVNQVLFSGDSRWLAAVSWNMTRLWDLATESASDTPIVLKAENSQFNMLAVSANGRWAVTTDHSRAPSLWSLDRNAKPTPRQLTDARGGHLHNLEISPDGRWLVAVNNSGQQPWLRVWDLSANDPLQSWREVPLGRREFYHNVLCRLLPDGRSLAVAAGDQITIWDLTADSDEKWKTPVATIPLREATEQGDLPRVTSVDHAQGLVSDRDVRWLLAVDYQGMISQWNLKTKDPSTSRVVIGRHAGGAPIDLVLSPSGRWLVSTRAGDAPRLWDLWRRNPQATGLELHGHDSSPNSTIDVAIGGGKLAGLGTGRQPMHLPFLGLAGRVRASLGLGERWLVTRGSDETLRLWDLMAEVPGRSGLQAGTAKLDAREVAIREDSNLVILRGGTEIQVVDPEDVGRVVTSVAVRPESFGLSWSSADEPLSHDGRWLALRTEEAISIFDLHSDQLLGQQSKAEDQAAPSSSTGGAAQPAPVQKPAVWQPAVAGGRWLQQFLNPLAPGRIAVPGAHLPHKVVTKDANSYFNAVVVSPNGDWLLTQLNNRWELLNLRGTDSTVRASDLGKDVLQPVFSPDGRWLAAYRRADSRTPRTRLSFWNLTADPPRSSEHDLGQNAYATEDSLAFSGDGRWLAAAAGGIQVRPIADDGMLGAPLTLTMINEARNTQRIALSRDGRFVAASESQTVHLWDRKSQNAATEYRILRGHEQSIDGLAVSPDGAWLISASQDGDVLLWDLRDEQLQDTMIALNVQNEERRRLNFRRFLFSPDGRWIAVSTWNGIHLWQLDPSGLLDEARRLAGRELTPDELARYRLNTPERQRERLLRRADEVSKRLEKDPQDPTLMDSRAHLLAQAGQFQEAIDDWRMLIRLKPTDHWPHYRLLSLLAQAEQADAYRRAGEAMARKFAETEQEQIEIYERVAKGSLFWSESGADWKKLAPLAERSLQKAIEKKHWVLPWAQIVKGLAEYRLGNYAAALEWADQGLGHSNSATTHSLAVPGNVLKSMAHAQLAHRKEARDALATAKAAQARAITPLQGSEAWHDWYMGDIMLREAEAVLLEKSPPETAASINPKTTKQP